MPYKLYFSYMKEVYSKKKRTGDLVQDYQKRVIQGSLWPKGMNLQRDSYPLLTFMQEDQMAIRLETCKVKRNIILRIPFIARRKKQAYF